jgi:very-short-patch-repair endonuclease
MHPEQFALFLPILFILIIAVAVKKFIRSESVGNFSYERTDRLFSPAERSFLGVLEQIFGNEYRIIGKVRIADIIRPRRDLSASTRTSAFNRIAQKHVDFAVCDPQTLQVLGVIELDDSSHNESPRRRRDKFVDAALFSARVPFVRIAAQRVYTPQEIRERVSVLFGRA